MSAIKAMKAVRQVMEEQGVSPASLGRKLNIPSNTLYGRFNQENVSVGKLVEMLQALDYKIVIVPGGTNVKGGIEIE